MSNLKNEIESCEITKTHKDIIDKVKDLLPEEEKLYDLAELFKVFGDSTRIKIICVLFESEMCVCDISAILGMSQSAVSHQLRVLKQAKLVKYRKDGKVVYYSLDDEHIKAIFNMGLEHIEEM
ncbi:ArsR/SmtB family transcription factor [Clostridium oryzae]|uniref:HTH arsR-type domain-containing protein n=1 Tax=Clostridium oryzae TaxID=1450648 RepID=A0A1V4IYX4_9CLOT|nr:metalloregulator ArsR/SmtB family transcription factor [Clostridium oryzae]OPJ65020.1 hypothetical protein CLORY_00200 [Clostridium oryzae]